MTKNDIIQIIKEELAEAKKKKVIRKGKRVKKLDCKTGYKAKDGKCTKMSSKEKLNRKKAAKKAARKSKPKKKQTAKKRARSMKKRTWS